MFFHAFPKQVPANAEMNDLSLKISDLFCPAVILVPNADGLKP